MCQVGMMRSGRLLEEGSPNDLVARYQAPTLETLFLRLCCHDDMDNHKIGRVSELS